MNKEKRPNCYKCIYYYITWEKIFSYGCKAFGIKGRRMPSLEVFSASKENCKMFKAKSIKKKSTEL